MNEIKVMAAFSLIELMVVIAIVAILSAVAVPEYKNYVTRSKIASALTFVNDLQVRAISYYSEKGVFPNAYQAGLPADPQDPGQTNVNDYFAPNIFAIAMSSITPGPNGCPAGTIDTYLSDFGAGDATVDNNAGLLLVQNIAIDLNNTIVKKCVYNYISGGVPVSGDLISGCDNLIDNPDAGQALQDALDSC